MAEAVIAEEWRPIEGFEGYEVSSAGSVRTWHRRFGGRHDEPVLMAAAVAGRTCQYLRVTFRIGKTRTSRTVHRIVCRAFHGPAPDGYVACHNNGDHLDNRAENLRWDTQKNNHQDAVSQGTHPGLQRFGINNSGAKLDDSQVLEIRKRYEHGTSQSMLCSEFGMSPAAISMIVRRKTWKHI